MTINQSIKTHLYSAICRERIRDISRTISLLRNNS